MATTVETNGKCSFIVTNHLEFINRTEEGGQARMEDLTFRQLMQDYSDDAVDIWNGGRGRVRSWGCCRVTFQNEIRFRLPADRPTPGYHQVTVKSENLGGNRDAIMSTTDHGGPGTVSAAWYLYSNWINGSRAPMDARLVAHEMGHLMGLFWPGQSGQNEPLGLYGQGERESLMASLDGEPKQIHLNSIMSSLHKTCLPECCLGDSGKSISKAGGLFGLILALILIALVILATRGMGLV